MLSPLGANKFPNAMGLKRVIDPFTKYQDTFSHQDKHSFHVYASAASRRPGRSK
jgi:hypothetical protein